MDTWKLLLITLLSSVVLGCIVGVATGKHQVKKARGGYKPLLSVKERILYSLSIVLGAACILFGVLVLPDMLQPEQPPGDGGNVIEENQNDIQAMTGGGVIRRSGGVAASTEVIVVG